MSRYVRLCESVYDYGKLINPSDIYNLVNSEKEYFSSTYYYNNNQYAKFKETGTVKGIRDVTTDKLWWDFDNKTNPSEAQTDCIELVHRLREKQIPTHDIQVYFSGNKGFNVVVDVDKELTPNQVYNICVDRLGDNLKTLDTSLYDSVQILRVPGTKHQQSGLYKIPLSVEELNKLSIDDIKNKASSLDNLKEDFNWGVAHLDDNLVLPVKKEKIVNKQPIALNFTNKPSTWKNCKWALLQGYFKNGERHNSMLVLAATCRGLGYDKETTYYMCKSALKKQALHTGQDEFPKEELWENIIEQSVFTDGWEGGQYSCKQPGWLQTYCKSLGENSCKIEEEKSQPICIHDISEGFKNYVLNIDENTIRTGIKRLDERMPLTIGMNLGLVGAASSGKTSVALEILKNTSKAGVTSVFASLDMHRNRLFEKLLYKVSGGKSREEVYATFKDNKENDLVQKIKEDYGNVYFYDRSSPSVTDIRRYIEEINSNSPKKVKLVMLDYFERVTSDRSEDTAASKDIAGKLQDLVNDYNICLVTLVQPNKFSITGGPDKPLLNYTAIKGSSFLYQSFRSIISIWRPFFNPLTIEKDKFMQMAIIKNDLGELATLDFGFEGKTGRVYELEDHQKEDLKKWLKEKEEEGKETKDDWN